MASDTMMRLPTMAFNNPPSPPGGGVIFVNRSGDNPPSPNRSTSTSIHASQNTPNAMAASDRPNAMRLVHLRRTKRLIGSAYYSAFADLQLRQQPLGERQHQ